MANPDIDLNDPKNMLQFIDDPIEKFNMFIKKWCPDYSHLIDSDMNDGQEIRKMIRNLMSQAQGSDLVAPDSETNTDAANPPSLPPNEQPDELDTAYKLAYSILRPYNVKMQEVDEAKAAIERYTTSQQVRMLDKTEEAVAAYFKQFGAGMPLKLAAVLEQLRKELQDGQR